MMEKKLIEEAVVRDFRLLTETQQKLFIGYGLRVIKYMFEKDLSRAELNNPENTVIQGVNSFGRWQAIDTLNQLRYVYHPHNNEWVQSLEFEGGGDVDLIDDLRRVYNLFGLKNFSLESLTHIHSEFIENRAKKLK